MPHGFGHGRHDWTEHGGMHKGNKVGQFGCASGSIGSVIGQWLYVELP